MNKIFALFLCLNFLSINSFASLSSEEKQFPNPGQIYVPGKDTGFAQYAAKSLKGSKKIVLTFDDGPDEVTTPLLLNILKQHNVKATFFVLTERINDQTYPIIKRMITEGHNVASHHHDHVNNDSKPEAAYRAGLIQSISTTARILEFENSSSREIYYRFPYGAYGSKTRNYHHLNVMKTVSKELFGENCINFAFWDIDTVDWLPEMSPQDIKTNVLANIFGGTGFDFKRNSNGNYSKVKKVINKPLGGGVVLMHDVHKRTVDSIDSLLSELKQRGVEIVSLQSVDEYSYNGLECRLISPNP